MIDRKALWFLILLTLAMTAAALWRISVAPDWTQLLFVGRNGATTTHSLFLFVPALVVLSMIPFSALIKWLAPGPEDAARAHHRMGMQMLLAGSVLAAMAQGFMISRSLGYGLELNNEVFGRATIVLMALLIIVQGNNMPKLPWIASRFPAYQLDAWQQARSQRFTGRLSILFGIALIVAAALLPMRIVPFITMAFVPVYLGLIVWYALRLKREPSALS